MKSLLIVLLASFAFAMIAGAAQAEDVKPKKKVLRHVVLFKFKDDATKEQIKTVTDAFAELPGKIDSIIDYEWGTDVSPEGKAEGLTHCFLVTFADEKGRDAYLPHAAHQDFVKILRPILDKVVVVDYWSN